jgi:hypothetical protein
VVREVQSLSKAWALEVMAKKTKTIAKEVDDVAKLMQKLVRLKAADDNGYVKCCTCGMQECLTWSCAPIDCSKRKQDDNSLSLFWSLISHER